MLTNISPGKWQVLEDYLLPFAESIGYKAFYPHYTTKRKQVPTNSTANSQEHEGAEVGTGSRHGYVGSYEEEEDEL